MSSAISVSGLTFTYPSGERPTLSDISFAVPSGRPLLVLGPSGAGKSTLALCLAGVIPQVIQGDYHGEVRVGDLSTAETPVYQLAKEAGLVFQDPDSQFCTLTVEDEIAFGLENLGWPPEEIENTIDYALDLVGLAGFRGRQLSSLSGGEKQRTALASIIAMKPRVLLLDEPSSHLDPHATAALFALLRRLSDKSRCTMVVIEHKLDDLLDWIKDVLVLDLEGSRLASGDARQVFYQSGPSLACAGVWRPQTVELVEALRKLGWDVPGEPLTVKETAAALLETAGLVGRLSKLRGGLHARNCEAEIMRRARPKYKAKPEGDVLLLVSNLRYSYPVSGERRPALDKVSFSLPRGGFLAIAGPSGAGKTTLGLILSGILKPPPGTVRVAGEDISSLRLADISRKVGHVFQNPEHQFLGETVLGELALSLVPFAGRKAPDRLTQEQRALVLDWLTRLGLRERVDDSPFALSHGQKRRLSVATMLIREPSLLVLDEPTLGQDEAQVQRLMDLVEDFRARNGSVVMITHDMRLVAEYADVLLVLVEGRRLFFGPPRDFFADHGLVERAGMGLPPVARVARVLGEESKIETKGLISLADFVERLS